MKRISWLNLLLTSLIIGLGSYGLFQLLNFLPRVFNAVLAVIMLAILLGEVICGLAVKRLKARESTWISPLQAPYVALTAQALAYWGSGLLGYLLALGARNLQLLHADATGEELLKIAVFLVLALLCIFVSLLVEKWCLVDREDEDEKRSGSKSSQIQQEKLRNRKYAREYARKHVRKRH